MSDKIPTAEVVINYLIPNAKNLMTARQYENALDAVRKHGKYYVEAALKAANQRVKLDNLYQLKNDSILSAYNLDNIK